MTRDQKVIENKLGFLNLAQVKFDASLSLTVIAYFHLLDLVQIRKVIIPI